MLLPDLRIAPTPSPRLPITQAALLEDRILKRTLDTCGWISGNSASPIACPAGYSCQANILGRFACCNAIQCSADWFTCQAHDQAPICGGLDQSICSSIFTSILTCGSEAPFCVTYQLSSSLDAATTINSLGCATTSGPILVLGSITNAGSGGTTTQQTAQPSVVNTIASSTNVFTSPITTIGSTTTDSTAIDSTTTRSTTTGSTTTGSTTNFESSSTGASTTKVHVSTTVIVVIVVLGIVLLAVIGLGICICQKCMRRRRTESYQTRVPSGPGEFEPEPTELSDSVSRTSHWVDNSGPHAYENVPALPPRSDYSGTTTYGGHRT
ncbi:Hypothetical protein R9X50_00519000 [Acrodontium crateriforme]|uniref:Uncharacterized protein n=1 Tax=Acrodontium crateriforme TaxID=150365 RepID=A0AAQ3MCB2_9PEZI|nr:Hypothetical protein R9X50_00519000 [Acrodontium crateriforme]